MKTRNFARVVQCWNRTVAILLAALTVLLPMTSCSIITSSNDSVNTVPAGPKIINIYCYKGNHEWYVVRDSLLLATLPETKREKTFTCRGGTTLFLFFSNYSDWEDGTLYVRRDGEFREIGYCNEFCISDDGRYVAYTDQDYTLRLYSVEDQKGSRVAQNVRGAEPVLSPTGRILLYYNEDGYLTMCRQNSSGKTSIHEIRGKLEKYSVHSVDDSGNYIYATKYLGNGLDEFYWLNKGGKAQKLLSDSIGTLTINRDHTQMIGHRYGTIYFVDRGKVTEVINGYDPCIADGPFDSWQRMGVEVYDVEDLKTQVFVTRDSNDVHNCYWCMDYDGFVIGRDLYVAKLGQDGHTLYCMEEDGSELYTVDLNIPGQRNTILQDIEKFYKDDYDRIYYKRDKKIYLYDGNNDKYICEHLYAALETEDGGLAFFCDNNSNMGVLYVMQDNEPLMITDKVYRWGIHVNNGKCLFLSGNNSMARMDCYVTDIAADPPQTTFFLEDVSASW